jgi:hypothetical protein
MQSPTGFNNQHAWGGQRFQTGPDGSQTDASDSELDTPTLLGNGNNDRRFQPLPQTGFTASTSDDVFHPAPGGPSSTLFTLSDVPYNPNPRYPSQRPVTHLNRPPLPYRSSFSSYNNPGFNIPPGNLDNYPPVDRGPPPSFSSRPHPHVPIHTEFVHPAYIQRPLNPPPLTPACQHCSHSHSSPSHGLPVLSKTLPSVAHITLLTSKLDFFAWEEGVSAVIRANGLIGHILDPSEPLDPSRPDRTPSLAPVLPPTPSPQDLATLNHWWDEDNIAQHILVSRLGAIPLGLLPSPKIFTCTALSIYKALCDYYGTSSYAECTELLSFLQNSVCTSGRVQEYVSKWRTGLSRLQSARFSFNVRQCITFFVRGLPFGPAFDSIRSDLHERLDYIHDQDIGAFIALTDRTLRLDTVFRSASNVHNRRTQRPPVHTTATPPALPTASVSASTPVSTVLPTTVPDSSSRPPRQVLTCSNCKSRGLRSIGHVDGTCFQPGGGMEGRRDEYLNNKGRMHAMFAECLESAFLMDSDTPFDSSSRPPSPQTPPIIDNDLFLPPIANLCVSSFPANSDIRDDLYYRCDPELIIPFAYTSADFQNTAFLSMIDQFNALLDSGCTHHIVRDRALFQNYTSKAVSIGTANCGSLNALGSGDVEFRYPFGERHVIFTLRNCLHAPSAPINLLSVGALVERGMSCLFSPGGITKVSYPDTHPKLPGFAFSATVLNRLSFLNLAFISPSVPALSSVTAFPAHAPVPPLSTPPSAYSFPRLKLDSMLWHRRFGHIGMDATRVALTKDYVTGVRLDGPFTPDHCISCIIGKSPRKSYPFRGNRATKIGELLHMDLCGPFPVQGPRGEKYFYNILDDMSNWGFTFGLRLKSDAFSHFQKTAAFLERSNGITILNIRCGGELELTAGPMGDHLASKGIVVQRAVPYAHQQNGKSERYIRTIEEGGQALLADTGLPMSFWLDAMLTRQYLVNRLPTSTLPDNLTPFELITDGRKPDLSHLRVWGCDCYVAVPDELRSKAGFKRFQAIFVGYEEHRTGWRVRDLQGKYSFSNDVIFNENLSGRLGISRPLSTPNYTATPLVATVSRPARDQPRIRTTAGQDYDEVLRLKEFRRVERERQRSLAIAVVPTGDASAVVQHVDALSAVGVYVDVPCDGDVVSCVDVVPHVDVLRTVGAYGGAPYDVDVVSSGAEVLSGVIAHGGESGDADGTPDFSPSMAVIEAFFSLIASSSLSDPIDTFSLGAVEPGILWDHLFLSSPTLPHHTAAFRAVGPPSFPTPRSFDLSKAPLSYSEAMARPDVSVWRAAMEREQQSLRDMGAFEEATLPPGEKTIGLKWVYAYKTDEFGVNIKGKEKARLVAQGFNQRPGQFDETYAPVAKMASVRILLAWAAVQDYEIFQFDCKTAFLHAKLRHTVYARPFPGFPTSDPYNVLRILVALYGLRQSAYEFYILIMSLLLDLGMVRCEVDHGVFIGEWSSPPDPSIVMPLSGLLVLYIPLHVDDGLAITNSLPLYTWFLRILSTRLHIVDLGPCSKFLSILIIRDRVQRKLWLSSHIYVSELLDEWNMGSCKVANTPFPSVLSVLPTAPSNSLPELSDADLVPRYQRLVGCLLYLAIATRPDISYYAMWLGQFNATPTRAHFLAAKHVLRYLAGTKDLALCFGASSPRVPSTLSAYMQNVGCSDADWASDTVDRKSISGYSFYFQGSLVSWSAVKQKSIALSSTEAEYYAMSHAFKEALWLRTFLIVLKFPVPRPFPILSDNQAACSLSNSPAISARSKHIDIRHHFIRDHVLAGSFSTTWIPTDDMPADIFTKALPFPVFSRHRDVLGLSIPPSLV